MDNLTVEDTRSYVLLENDDAVVKMIQQDFLSLAVPLVDERAENPILKAAHLGEPGAYGGKFPAWIFYRITSRGMSRNSEALEKMLAEEYMAEILVVDRATMPAGGAETGRGFAERRTREGFSAWMDNLAKAWGIQSKTLGGIYRDSTNAGSFSEFGRAMFVDEQQTLLWAHSAMIRLVL